MVQKAPALADAHADEPSDSGPLIVLNTDGGPPERNGFSWRANSERIEIHGESARGLCNGIYSFLSALGISWPAPEQEMLPSPQVANLRVYSLSSGANVEGNVFEPSNYEGKGTVSAPWRRFFPAAKQDLPIIMKKSEAFVDWAARRRYDALIFPLSAFASRSGGRRLNEIAKLAAEYGISLEAGGRELSSLLPRRLFLLHRDYFRMEGGRRKKDHHFCPTNPGAIQVICKEGERLFRTAAEAKVFHLWPDKGAATAWCSCPSCRAFTPAEQNRIGVNAAADALAQVNPAACITFFEKRNEGANVPLRESLYKMEKLPDEKEYH